MKIKDFEIKNLYGKYSFKSHLDEKVNIIVGNNGTFKTTLLNILNNVTSFVFPVKFFLLDTVTISEDSNISVKYEEFKSTISELGKKVNERNVFKPLYEKALSESNDNGQRNNLVVSYNVLTAFENGKEIENGDYTKQVKVDFVSTFDINGDGKEKERSFLDSLLEKLQSDYGYYQSDLMKELTDRINTSSSITKAELDKINEQKSIFANIVNEAFAETGKQLSYTSSKLTFENDGEIIDTSGLSSGEKQLLVIMLTVLLERNQEYILMMDEPEISMHISWQYKLIDWIQQLNPNVQIILTTHSPMIFSDGWGDKVIYMENITTKTRK